MPNASFKFLLFFAVIGLFSFNAYPVQLNTMTMLVMSNDHELFRKAYTDFEDLDGDGMLDSTYNNAIAYDGYFNSLKCYDYTTGVVNAFLPSGDVDSTTEGSEDYKCTGSNSNKWSGNFLNWATMTRMDIIRKALYGGKRIVDTASLTVLERALIPDDIHAFVKVAVDSEIADGRVVDYTPYSNSVTEISICNVTDYVSGASDQTRNLNTLSNPPLIKVAEGQYPQWSSSEVVQCQFTDEGGRTPTSPVRSSSALSDDNGSNGEYQVRVGVCINGEDDDADYCREYMDSVGVISKKPAGLLQRYGENSAAKFGLITGSYQQNNEGGVLRKNITSFAGDTVLAADNELNLETGVFNPLTNGIVSTLDAMRIAGWDYGSNKYTDCDTFSIPISTFKYSNSSNRQCRDWGNPISEMYLEALRYFSGVGLATSDFNVIDDNFWIPGINKASWSSSNLITSENVCSNCSVVLLSIGPAMFDGDDLGSAGDLPGIISSADVSGWTEDVGDAEGLTGAPIIAGNTDNTSNSNVCSVKTLTSVNGGLAGVNGLCPEAPGMEGTYEVAGLAYYAKQTDLRALVDFPQTITTHAVEHSYKPSFTVEAGNGNTVKITPECQSNTSGSAALASSGWTYCSIADVRVVTQTEFYGHLLISWEDSSWGNDYDMDGISSIEYCTATGNVSTVQVACPKYSTNGSDPDWAAASAGEVQIRASVPQANAGNALRFGFIIDGAMTANGSYINVLRPGGQTIFRLNGYTGGTIRWDSVRKFIAGNASSMLNSPLWYAAKYGGFKDLDQDGSPLHSSYDDREWDSYSTTGELGSDGIPDTYYPLVSMLGFKSSLERIFTLVTKPDDLDGDGFGDIFEQVYGLDPLVDEGLRPNDDQDFDGLSLIEELILGTLDINPDTDGDGLTDKFESTRDGADPTNMDQIVLEEEAQMCDINSDGTIDVSDVLLLQKQIIEPQP